MNKNIDLHNINTETVSEMNDQFDNDSKETDLITLEQKLSLLTINSEESFVLVDTNYKIIAFNRQFRNEYLKYFGTEFKKGDSIFSLVHESRKPMVEKIYQRVFAGKTEFSEINIPLPDGDQLIISNKFKPAFNEDGQIVGAFVTSSDVTGLRKIQEEKHEADRQKEFESKNLRALINTTKDLIWSIDLQHRLLSFNESFQTTIKNRLNFTPVRGTLFFDCLSSPEVVNRLRLYINRAESGDSFTVVEHSLEPTEEWIEIGLNPIRETENGEILGIAFTARNITERKSFEKSLILSQNRLKQAQEMANIGNWELNFSTQTAKWSDESYRIYGIEPDFFDHSFESWLNFVHPEDLEHVKANIKIGYDTLDDYSFYHRIIRPDGEIRHLYSTFQFEFDLGGKPKGLYGVVQDITDRRMNEIKLQELLRKSNSQNKWLNNFNHMVAHNLRSNSNNINGIIELISDAESEEERAELTEMLKHSSHKLSETVENLSEFLMFQNQKELPLKRLNLKEEILKTCDGINHLIQEKGGTTILDVGEDLWVEVIPSYLESILINLCSNSIKYCSASRPLVLEFKGYRHGEQIVLAIKDNGIGIDLEKHGKNIFGMFSTFHGNPDAIGFGLFMTKNQIELMNGRIEVESEPDKGSTFILYFS